MMFRKDVEQRCAYCTRSVPTEEGLVMCVKRGIMKAADSCHSFRYDPLKRTPPRPVSLKLDQFQDEDFTL